MGSHRRIEDLEVYGKLCRLHIEVCDLTHRWPAEEKYELGSQARRSSNSAGAQLRERYDDRHIRNKIEGVNRSRGEAAEAVHHLYMAHLKGYETRVTFEAYEKRYQECIRMLNGMERALEKHLPERERRWPQSVQESPGEYGNSPPGFPDPPPEPRTPNPEPRAPSGPNQRQTPWSNAGKSCVPRTWSESTSSEMSASTPSPASA